MQYRMLALNVCLSSLDRRWGGRGADPWPEARPRPGGLPDVPLHLRQGGGKVGQQLGWGEGQ